MWRTASLPTTCVRAAPTAAVGALAGYSRGIVNYHLAAATGRWHALQRQFRDGSHRIWVLGVNPSASLVLSMTTWQLLARCAARVRLPAPVGRHDSQR
jgi:hypothetical protein